MGARQPRATPPVSSAWGWRPPRWRICWPTTWRLASPSDRDGPAPRSRSSSARPWGGLLAVAGVIATLALLLIGYEVWRLEHLTGTLARVLRAHHIAPPTDTARSRAPGRLVLFVAALLGVQVALVGLVGALCPMPITMVMNGVPMAMPGAPPLPLAPVHLLVAIVLGMFLWRVEHRLTRLRAVVTRQRRLLAAACVTRAPLAPPRTARLPRACHGLTLFARPPPRPAAPSLA